MRKKVILKNLEKWKNNLLDKTMRNRLFNYKPAKVRSLYLIEPSTQEIVDRLIEGRKCSFFLPPLNHLPPDHSEEEYEDWIASWPKLKKTEIKLHHNDRKKCQSALKILKRKNHQSVNELGFHILYVCSGLLRWYDPNSPDKNWVKSPLFLSEVEIETPRGENSSSINLNNDSWVLNPTLVRVFSSDYGVDLEEDLDFVNSPPYVHYQEILNRVKNIIPEANIIDELLIDIFQFKKERIFRDLDNNKEKISNHPFIGALCHANNESEIGAMSFDEPDINNLDNIHPPEKLHNILDSDSTQQIAIIACKNGESFVMDGPPGTGKSQSISNMIAELLADGKKVLFVSEKAAALEVVQNRLKDNHLGDYTLAIHDENATNKKFIEELYRSLNSRPSLPPKRLKTSKLLEYRSSLSEHSLWMNAYHEDIEMSMIEAIGRFIQLHDLPLLPKLEDDSKNITRKSIEDSIDAGHSIIDEWDIFEMGDDNPWVFYKDKTINQGDKFEIKEKTSSYLVAIETIQNIHVKLDSLFSLSGPLNYDQICSYLDSLEKFRKFRNSEIPENYYDPAKFSSIKQAFFRLIDLNEKLLHIEENMPIKFSDFNPDFGLPDFEDNLNVLNKILELNSILKYKEIDKNKFNRISKDIDSAIQIGSKLEKQLKDLTMVLGSFELNELNFNAIESIGSFFLDISNDNMPNYSWFEHNNQRKIIPFFDNLKSSSMYLKIKRDSLMEGFNERILESKIADDCAIVRDAGFFGKFSLKYMLSRRRLSMSSISKKLPDIEGISKILEYHDLYRELDDKLSNGDWQILTDGEGLEKLHIEDLENNVSAFKSLTKLKSHGFSTANILDLIRAPKNNNHQILDNLEKIYEYNSIFKDHLSDHPIGFSSGCFRDFLTDLENFKNLIEQCNQLISEMLEKVEYSGKDVEKFSLPAIQLTTISIIQKIRYTKQIEDIINELEDDYIDISPLFRIGPKNDDLGREVVTFISDLNKSISTQYDFGNFSIFLSSDRLESMIDELEDAKDNYDVKMSEFQSLFDMERKFANQEIPKLPLNSIANFAKTAIESLGNTETHNRLITALDVTSRFGLRKIIDTFNELEVNKNRLPDAIERALLQSWIDAKISGEKIEFSGNEHERTQQKFKQLDEQLLQNKRAEIIERANITRPNSLVGFGNTINREKQKKRRHKPIREMLEEGFNFIQDLKPCIMMSPLTVSHYLPTENNLFDVVIFDEASQIRPEEAINCIYRSKQVIVAGDQKQLPPTSFFSGVDEYEDYDDEVEDFESLLDVSKQAQGVKSISLKWHYRSQHEDLITFSNHSFYSGDLFTFPSSREKHPSYGVKHTKVDGVYDRGRTGTNEIEAEMVYSRIEDLVKNNSNLTIGVVAFSQKQMSKIEQVVDAKRRNDPVMDEWFSSNESRLDGFFVKNIENVQGDERDVIIFSTGFGKDANGKFIQNFGPLNRETGWRRLNVAITRAKKQLEVVTSIDPTWIKPKSPSVNHFKRFLEYSERGPEIFDIDLTDSQGIPDSPFEEEVIREIRSWGYDVVPQVGCASYRIDMGIIHPSYKGHYCLAIECDGAMYHSSPVARDRDRLRENVLRNLGWEFHRIWGTTWYRERSRASNALKLAIEDAASKPPLDITRKIKQEHSELVMEPVEFESIIEDIEYKISSLPKSYGLYENTSLLKKHINTIVSKEGPIHKDLLYHRIRDAYLMENASSKLKTRVDHVSKLTGVYIDDDDFYWIRKKPKIGTYRNSVYLRKSNHVPKEEVAIVFQLIYDASKGTISIDELYQSTINLFSWGKRTKKVEAKLDKARDLWGKL